MRSVNKTLLVLVLLVLTPLNLNYKSITSDNLKTGFAGEQVLDVISSYSWFEWINASNWYTSYIDNVVLAGGIVVSGISRVRIENLRLFTSNGESFIFLVGRDYSSLIVNDVSPVSGDNASLFILAFGNANITISNLIVKSLWISALDNAFVKISNITILGGSSGYYSVADSSSISLRDNARVLLENISILSKTNFGVYLAHNSMLIVKNLDAARVLGCSFNIDIGDRSVAIFNGFYTGDSVATEIYTRSMGVLGLYNSSLTGSIVSIRSLDYSSVVIYDSYINGTSDYWDELNVYTVMPIILRNVTIKRIRTGFNYDLFSAPIFPLYDTLIINETRVELLDLASAPISALLINSEIGSMRVARLFRGSFNITSGNYSIGEGGFGPYPFVNVSSTVGSITVVDDYYFVNAVGRITNTTFSYNSLYVLGSKIEILNSELISPFILPANSTLEIYNVTGDFTIDNVYFSKVTLADIDNAEYLVQAFDGSDIEIVNNTVSNVEVVVQGSSESRVLLELYDVKGNSSSTLELNVYEGSLDINRLNISGYFTVTMSESSGKMLSSSIVSSSAEIYLHSSNLTINNSSFNGKITVDQLSKLVALNNTRIYKAVPYVRTENGVEIINNQIIGPDNIEVNVELDETSSIFIMIPSVNVKGDLKVYNSTVNYVVISGSTNFYLYNVSFELPTGIFMGTRGDDPRELVFTGWINSSNIPYFELNGIGNITVKDSYFGVLFASMVNITLIDTTVDTFIEMHKVVDETVNVSDNDFSSLPSFCIEVNSTINTRVYGLAAIGESKVTVAHSNISVIYSFDNSEVHVIDSVASGDYYGYPLLLMLFDSSVIGIENSTLKGAFELLNSDIITLDNSKLSIINSTIVSMLQLNYQSKILIVNSTIGGEDYEYRDITLIFSDSVNLTLKNSFVSKIFGVTRYAVAVFENITTNEYVYKDVSIRDYGKSTIKFIGGNLEILEFYGSGETVIALENTTIGYEVSVDNADSVNISWYSKGKLFTLTLNNVNHASIQNAEIEDAYITSSEVKIENFTIGNIHVADSTLILNNGELSYLDNVMSNVNATNTTIGLAALYRESTFKLYNSNVSGFIALDFVYQVDLPYFVTYYPNTTVVFKDSIVPYDLEEYIAVGRGILRVENDTVENIGSLTYGLSPSITLENVTVNARLNYTIRNYYIGPKVYANITNIAMDSGVVMGVIYINKEQTREPEIEAYLSSKLVANGSSLKFEKGMQMGELTFNLEGDAVLDKYALTLNNSLLETGYIRNTTGKITVNLDNLLESSGKYTVTLMVTDADGHIATYTLTITVLKSVPPQIIESSKCLKEFELGMDPGKIVWLINESFPGNYSVYINGSTIMSGPYENWWNVTVPVGNYITEPGTYNITLVANDKAGNYNSSTVIIKAYPSEAPVITSEPSNITIEVNSTVTLTWTATDRFPANYTIYINGTIVETGEWANNQNITYEFTATQTGVYKVTIVVKDKAGNEATSTVYIKVQATTQQTTTQPAGIGINLGVLSVGISVALIALVVLLYYIRKAKK